jgi:large subunit ribosomal protein L3
MAEKGIIGTKLGMTQIFDQESGKVTSVTVVEAGPCPVVQVKTPETDGYTAVQLAFGAVKEKRISKPEAGHLKKAGQGPHRHLVEIRDAEGLAVGDTVTVEAFEPGERIKVSGRSKGKGFAGTIKRHNFSRGPTSHGSHNVRKPGSIGASATPSRVFKGMRMSGHMGDERVTQRGLRVAEVDAERNLLLIAGAVPGSVGGVVEIRSDG